MDVTFSTGSLYGLPLAWVFRLARRAGFDAVEVVLTPEIRLRGGEWVRRLAARHGLRVAACHRALTAFPGPAETPAGLPRLVALAAAMGAPLLTLHPPRRTRSLSDPRARAFRHRLEALRPLAAAHAVTLALENLAHRRSADAANPFLHPPTLARFAADLDLALTLDTSHAASTGADLLALYHTFAPRLAHVHLSDYRPTPRWLRRTPLRNHLVEHQAPGQGALPLRPFLRALAADHFRGAVSLEIGPLPLRLFFPPALRPRLAAACRYVREALTAGGTSHA